MAAIFDSTSWLVCVLLLVCGCSYIHTRVDPECSLQGAVKTQKYGTGLVGVGWKMARIGERKSEFISLACLLMSVYVLFVS